ncbi:MAG: phosphate-starvation-inducible PsiE family protein [Actinobacteria bacterium]|nr:phosphate-starvation-inducible PsiE family protein [Actinomycetota bacterium]
MKEKAISKKEKAKSISLEIADNIATLGEAIIAALLLFILFMGIGSFIIQIFSSFSKEVYTIDAIKSLIDKALVLFIVLELYVITISYLKREPVVKEVLIAVFIAVGRKILIYDYEKWGLQGALSLGLLILAISVSFYFHEKITKMGREENK